MQIAPLLHIPRGVTALIGGGGKTTLMETLAEELRAQGTVLLTTTTHIRRPDRYETLTDASAPQIAAALRARGAVCVASPAHPDEPGKLTAPAIPFDELARLADFVIVEADGARMRPLKAHAPHEPALPFPCGRVVLVLGADGFGRSIRDACHRPELYAARCGASAEDLATPERAARVLLAEGYGDCVYINKAESPGDRESAAQLARLLNVPVVAGSLHRREYECLH